MEIKGVNMAVSYKMLSQQELADRWLVQPRTLHKWRLKGSGPPYLRIGRRILYREEDVEAYEQKMRIMVSPTDADSDYILSAATDKT